MPFAYQVPHLAGIEDDGCPYCGAHDGLRGLGDTASLEAAKEAKRRLAERERQRLEEIERQRQATESSGPSPLLIAGGVAVVAALALGVFKKKGA